jgi:CubicO group peptidase (beta-lactamase class C family)
VRLRGGLPGPLAAFAACAAALAVAIGAPGRLGAQPAESTEAREHLAASLQGILDSKIAAGEFVGAVFVGRVGSEIVEIASGSFDMEAGEPMRPDALFRLSSVSKAFTSVLAARMIADGRMALDDPVTKYLPGFMPKTPDGQTPEITLRQLLTHTSGVSYGFQETVEGPLHRGGVSDGCARDEGLSIGEEMRRLASVPLLSKPGSAWSYSLSADVMGAVMAAASGEPLQNLMRELVTGPLGLEDTAFHAKDVSRLAPPYVIGRGGKRPMRDPEVYPLGGGKTFEFSPGRALDPEVWPSGGCGMVSSARDVSRLTVAVMALADGTEIDRWFVSDAIAPLESDSGDGFGGGWAYLKAPVKGPYSPGTVAWSGVYGHRWFADPVRDISGALLTNTAMKVLSSDTMDLLAEKLYAYE